MHGKQHHAGRPRWPSWSPDYFANRKMVEFFHGEMVPVRMAYDEVTEGAGLDLDALEQAFKDGVKLFLFSNPNNPVGCVYSYDEICAIAVWQSSIMSR